MQAPTSTNIRKHLDQQVSDYYSSLSAEEEDELTLWANFTSREAADPLITPQAENSRP